MLTKGTLASASLRCITSRIAVAPNTALGRPSLRRGLLGMMGRVTEHVEIAFLPYVLKTVGFEELLDVLHFFRSVDV